MIDLVYSSERDIQGAKKRLSIVDSFFDYIVLEFRFDLCLYGLESSANKYYNLASIVDSSLLSLNRYFSIYWSPSGTNIELYVKSNKVLNNRSKSSVLDKIAAFRGQEYLDKQYEKIYSFKTGEAQKFKVVIDTLPKGKDKVFHLSLVTLTDVDNEYIVYTKEISSKFVSCRKSLVLGDSSDNLPSSHSLIVMASSTED